MAPTKKRILYKRTGTNTYLMLTKEQGRIGFMFDMEGRYKTEEAPLAKFIRDSFWEELQQSPDFDIAKILQYRTRQTTKAR